MATTVVRTIGTSSRQFPTLQLWSDGCPANLVTADQIWRGECYNDSEFLFTGNYDTACLIGTGVTTDATRYIELTTAAGQSFQDDAGAATNPIRYDQSKGVGIRLTGNFPIGIDITGSVDVRVSKLQIKGYTCVNNDDSVPVIDFNQMIMEGRDVVRLNGGKVRNSSICSTSVGGAPAVDLRYGASLFNCTVVRPSDVATTGTGVATNDSACIVGNCAVFGFTTAFSGTVSASSGYNCTNAASAPGSNNQLSKTYANQFENTVLATMNWRLKAGSDCIETGFTDSTNGANDIFGTARPQGSLYDIGAHELAGASGPNYTQTAYRLFADGAGLPTPSSTETPSFRASTVNGAGTGTTGDTKAIPASAATGDRLLCFVISRDHAVGNAKVTCTDNDTGGNTWVEESSSSDRKGYVFSKVATSGSASKTVTIAGAIGSCCAVVVALDGAGAVTDISVESNISGNETHAAITPTNAGSLIVAAVMDWSNDTNTITSPTVTTPGALTSRGRSLSTGGSDCSVEVFTALQTGGPTTTGAFTWAQTNGTTVSFLFAVAPNVIAATGRTPLASANTGATIAVADPFGAHVRVQNAGTIASEDTYRWQYSLNGGTWTAITTSSSVIKVVATADYANGDDVPEYIGGTGTYFANNNAALDTSGALTLSAVFPGVGSIESHITLEIVGADVVDDDVIELRIVQDDGTALDTYSQTPTITVDDPSTGIVNIGIALEADSALSMARKKLRAIGLASETDTGFSTRPMRNKPIGLASETDTATAIAKKKTKAFGLATETDSGQTIRPTRIKPFGLASETDIARAMAWAKSKAVGLATETDSALSIRATSSKVLGLASEIDTANAWTWKKAKAIGLATETDTARSFSIVAGGQIGQALETDSAFAMAKKKTKAIGLAVETDSGFTVTIRRNRTIGLATETDAAFHIAAMRAKPIGRANETDTAFALAHRRAVQMGIAIETDTAQRFPALRFFLIGQALETDTAGPVIRGDVVATTIEAALVAIVQTAGIAGGRIYYEPLPQNAVFPCLTYRRVDNTRVRNVERGPAGISYTVLEVNIYGLTYPEVAGIELQLANILDGYRGESAGHVILATSLENQSDLYEDARRVHRAAQEYRIAHREGEI